MPHLRVEGKQVYYEHHHPTAERVPVVLVHGWASNSRAWDETLSFLLAEGHPVVLLDLRGCGRSDADFDDVSIAALGRDVAMLVRELELQRPVLNGWSAGSAVAVEAAHQLDGEISGLVLTCPSTPRYSRGEDWEWGPSLDEVKAVVDGVAVDRPVAFRGVVGMISAKPLPSEVENFLWSLAMANSVRQDAILEELALVDQRDLLRGLNVPVLVPHGTDDPLAPLGAVAALGDYFDDVDLRPFEGCGHLAFLEDAPRYQALLRDFLAKVEGRVGEAPVPSAAD